MCLSGEVSAVENQLEVEGLKGHGIHDRSRSPPCPLAKMILLVRLGEGESQVDRKVVRPGLGRDVDQLVDCLLIIHTLSLWLNSLCCTNWLWWCTSLVLAHGR